MKTIKALILILLFTGVNYLYAQTPVIDFETVGNDWSYGLFGQGSSSFEIVANPDPSGINTSDSVACYIVSADATEFAGVFSTDFPDLTLDASNAIVTVMVWKDVISDFNLKLEPPNVDQRGIQNTVTGQWELLTYDYSAYIGDTVQTLTVVPDHIDVPRTAGSVIYYDNITFGPVPTARLQVIHNAADIAADPVDVYLDGTLLLDDFAFRAATGFIDAPAGVEINIGVAAGNSSSVDDTLKNFAVTLEDGMTYVAVANGVLDPNSYAANPDGRSTAFTLFINAMARETGTGSDVDFFVLHGATDAPTVDVIARGVGTLVDDAAYGDITSYIPVPPAEYTLDLTLADGTTLVQSYVADLSGLGGGSAAVFASGFLTPASNQNGEAFGLFFALADGTVGQFPIVTSVEEISSLTPKTYNLSQNYPNPFNPSTTINFSLPNNEFVTLKVYNILGGEVATLVNRELTAGSYEFDFNASNLASGIYFYELKAGNFAEIRKMNLLK
jgi:hypothetical protein